MHPTFYSKKKYNKAKTMKLQSDQFTNLIFQILFVSVINGIQFNQMTEKNIYLYS